VVLLNIVTAASFGLLTLCMLVSRTVNAVNEDELLSSLGIKGVNRALVVVFIQRSDRLFSCELWHWLQGKYVSLSNA